MRERAVLDGAALSILVLITGENGWTERPEIRERKGYWKSSAVDWNGVRNTKRRSGLVTVPGMSGCRISPRCWTAQGRHWLTSSIRISAKTLRATSNTSYSSNEDTGLRRAPIRLSWNMASPLCHNWKSRSDTGMCPSKLIWTSHSSPPNLNPQYGFWKSNPQQRYRQYFLRTIPCRSAVRRHCSKPVGTSRFLISFRKRGKFFTTKPSLKCVTNVLGYPFLMLQLATFRGGWSVCPCAMRKSLARFFLKMRILPDV